MKRCILLAGLFLTASTMAETIPYWRISSGWAEPGDADLSIVGIDVGEFNYDAGWIIEGAIGAQHSYLPVAYELAISYQSNDSRISLDELFDDEEFEDFVGESISVDSSIWTLMANGFYYLETDSMLRPYGLVGIGFLDYKADIEVIDLDLDDTVLAGQIGADIQYPIDDKGYLHLQYRYLFAQQAEDSIEGVNVELDINNHTVQLSYSQMY